MFPSPTTLNKERSSELHFTGAFVEQASRLARVDHLGVAIMTTGPSVKAECVSVVAGVGNA